MSTFKRAIRALSRVKRRQREIFGINRRNVELVYPHNRRRDYVLADDKLICKERLSADGIPVPETLAVCDGLFAIPSVLDHLESCQDFVIKPASGSGGDGIMVVGQKIGRGRWRKLDGRPVTRVEIRRHLANTVFGVHSKEMEDRAFVERRIVPHRTFEYLWRNGLCDLRVITLHAKPIVAMVRVPTLRSGGRANLHQGGIGLAVDLRTGNTVRAFYLGRSITRHPESGSLLVGIPIPAWYEILDISRRVAEAAPLKYLGIDLVVDRAIGPMVLEINARPGLEVQNVHGFGLGRALAREAA